MNRRMRLRAVAAAIAVLAFLVFLNLTQVDDENELALRTSGVLSTNVERVVREQRSAVISDAVYEALALFVAGVAVTVAIAGHRIQRPRLD
jgi:hypothetical protein